MNAVQQAAMKVEPIAEPMKLKPETVQPAADAMQKNIAKNILRVVSDGLGAVRRATFKGTDIVAAANLESFLRNAIADLNASLGQPVAKEPVKFIKPEEAQTEEQA